MLPLARCTPVLVVVGACSVAEPPHVLVPMQPLMRSAASRDAGTVEADVSPTHRLSSEGRTVLGRWEGTGVQGDGTSWLMVVDISSLKAGPCATALYPTVPCAGAWRCLTDSGGNTLTAVERITQGRRECVDGGTMQMFLAPDGALEWSWAGGGETAHARLLRSNAP